MAVPWAGKHSRFTLMFEAFAIDMLQAARSVQAAAVMLSIDWSTAQAIMERAVERGLERRNLDTVKRVGIDEKSFRKGHDYASVMTDIDGSRVLEVAPERTIEACDSLWNTLSDEQKKNVEAVAMDMWQAFETSTQNNVPNANIVHDRFHISQYLGDAVDKVRRAEHKSSDCGAIHLLVASSEGRPQWYCKRRLSKPGAWLDIETRGNSQLAKTDCRAQRFL